MIKSLQTLKRDLRGLKSAHEATPVVNANTNVNAALLHAYEKYILQNVEKIFDDSTKEPKGKAEEVVDFLQKNWELIKGTSLSYTAIPTNATTQFLCDIAQWSARLQNEGKLEADTPLNAVSVLMPSVSTDSISDDFPDLSPEFCKKSERWRQPDVQMILKSHIAGEENNYLIPVKLFVNHLCSEEYKTLPFNPYYDFSSHDAKFAQISKKEWQRLENHSFRTIQLKEQQEKYDSYLDNGSDFLSHIKRLIRHLHANDSVMGVGAEDTPGEGAYSAIIQFHEYYHALDKNEIEKIPQTIRDEIELLFKLTTDKEANKNGTEADDVKTCIATRRVALSETILGHEDKLSDIALEDAKTSRLLKESNELRQKLREECCNAIDKDEYDDGKDDLSFTAELLKTLGVTVEIRSERDWKVLQELNVQELDAILQLNDVRRNLLGTFRARDKYVDLIAFLHGMSAQKIGVSLTHLANNLLYGGILNTKGDYRRLLMTFESEKIAAICQSTKSWYAALAYSERATEKGRNIACSQAAAEFLLTFEEFDAKKFQAFGEAYAEEIFEQRKDLIQHLSPDKVMIMFKLFKPEWMSQIIQEGDSLAIVLEKLDEKQSQEFIEVYAEEIFEQHKELIKHLSPDKVMIMFKLFKPDWMSQIIQEGDVLNDVFKKLQPASLSNRLDAHHILLKTILSDMEKKSALEKFSPEEKKAIRYFVQSMKGFSNDFTQHINHYRQSGSGQEAQQEVYSMFKKQCHSASRDLRHAMTPGPGKGEILALAGLAVTVVGILFLSLYSRLQHGTWTPRLFHNTKEVAQFDKIEPVIELPNPART